MFEVATLDTYVSTMPKVTSHIEALLACISLKSSSPRDLRVPCIYAHERSSDTEAKSHKLPLKRN